MKNLYLIVLLSFFGTHVKAQSINVEITQNTENPYLLGEIDKSGLEGDNYKSWFTSNFESYHPEESIINRLKSKLDDYDITVFMGTWCGDSKKEVPKFYKVLEASDFPISQLKVIAVSQKSNMYKQSPQHEEKGLNIHRVPTFIFYKKGKEVNRIVEHPVESIEKDMLKIISKKDYSPHYIVVEEIHKLISKKGLKGLVKNSEKLVEKYKSKVVSVYELNTYGKVLFSSGQKDLAVEVFRLNTWFYPNASKAYMTLANTLGLLGQKDEAIKVLKNAITNIPEDNNLKLNLRMIEEN